MFDGVAAFMQSGRVNEEDIKEAVLQVCSEIDKPDPPGPAARKAFSRLIVGLSDEVRKTFKQQLLQVTPQEVLQVAERYFAQAKATPGMAVIAGEDQLQQANAQLKGKPLKVFAMSSFPTAAHTACSGRSGGGRIVSSKSPSKTPTRCTFRPDFLAATRV